MRKKHKWLIIALIVLVALFFLFKKPSYPDTITPKPVAGNPDAAIVIEEFSDLQCPACRAAHPVTKQLIADFGDRIQLQYKHFPLTSIHPRAFAAAEASECANDQGMFWEYVDTVFANQERLGQSDLKSYAAGLGMDTKLFNDCLASGKKAKIVSGEQREGLARQVQGTPTFFFNGEQMRSWNYDVFKQMIEQASS